MVGWLLAWLAKKKMLYFRNSDEMLGDDSQASSPRNTTSSGEEEKYEKDPLLPNEENSSIVFVVLHRHQYKSVYWCGISVIGVFSTRNLAEEEISNRQLETGAVFISERELVNEL